MSATTLVPVDPSTTVVPEVLVFAGEASSVPPDVPAPTPGDPDTPFVPAAPRKLGRRVQLMLTEPTTHRPLTVVETAFVESCSFRFGPGSLSAKAAVADPAWEYAAERTASNGGLTVVDPDLKSVDVALGLDGARFWGGIFAQPQRIGGGQFQLSADSAEAVLDQRAIGETEQRDYYQGRGSFPDENAFTTGGWSKTANVAYSWLTSGQYEGDRSLRLTAYGSAPGRVYGPWVSVPGHPERVSYPIASSVVRIDSDVVMQVQCEVQLADGTPVAPDFTLTERGVSNDADSTWQVVAGTGRLSAVSGFHRVRAVLVIPAVGTPVDVDLVQIQWDTLTGYPVPTDLARYPARILRDAQSGPGGSDWGIVTSVSELTGVLGKILYQHQADIPVGQAMRNLREMAGGPDWYITPGWRCLVGPRGSYRTDVALTEANILACDMAPDPGGETDEFRGITNIGTGTYRHVHAVDQPRRTNRRRQRQLVSVPDELGYGPGRLWTEGQAGYAAQPGWTGTVKVTFDEGLLYTEGDVVLLAHAAAAQDGAAGFWGDVMVADRTFDFLSDTCTMRVGTRPEDF